MDDYISRDAASDLLAMALIDDWEPEYAQDRLSEIPAADVRPVAEISNAVDEVLDFLNENSNCMPYHIYSSLFDLVSGICHNCGADMREV